MVCKCEGCKYELEEALYQQDNYDLCQATVDDMDWTFPDCKGHFGLFMVDQEGNWRMG